MTAFDILLSLTLFFGSAALGIVIGVLTGIFCSYLVQYDLYEMLIIQAIDEDDENSRIRYQNLKDRLKINLKFVAILVIILTFVILCVFIYSATSLHLFPQTPPIGDNSTCISQNITNVENNYNYTVYEINIDRNPPPISIEELKRLMQKRLV